MIGVTADAYLVCCMQHQIYVEVQLQNDIELSENDSDEKEATDSMKIHLD